MWFYLIIYRSHLIWINHFICWYQSYSIKPYELTTVPNLIGTNQKLLVSLLTNANCQFVQIRQLNQIYYILYNYKMKEYRIDQSTKSKGFKLFYVCFLQFIKSNKYAYILLCIFFYAYSFMNVLLCIFFYIYSSMYILLCIFFYVYSSMYILLCIFVYLFLYYLSNTEQCKSM